jgi:Flp pilus assembly protein TadG
MVLVVLFIGWLSIGLWTAYAERRQLAAAADQAAQAGATALDTTTFRTSGVRTLQPDLAETRAWTSLEEQDLGEITAAVVNATTDQITVVLESDVDNGLLSLFGGDNEPLHVRVLAIARPRE